MLSDLPSLLLNDWQHVFIAGIKALLADLCSTQGKYTLCVLRHCIAPGLACPCLTFAPVCVLLAASDVKSSPDRL